MKLCDNFFKNHLVYKRMSFLLTVISLSFVQAEIKCYGPHDENKICLDSKKSSLCLDKDVNGRQIPKNDCSGPTPCYYVKDVVAVAVTPLTQLPQTIDLPSEACSSVNSMKSIKLPVNKNNITNSINLTKNTNQGSQDSSGNPDLKTDTGGIEFKENIVKLPYLAEYTFKTKEFVAKPNCVYDFAGVNEKLVMAGETMITYSIDKVASPKTCEDFKIVSKCVANSGFDVYPGGSLSCNGVTPPSPPVTPEPKEPVIIMNGVCGSSSGLTFSSQPTQNLCQQGVASVVTDNVTDWTWSCNGLNGGSSANCSANKKMTTDCFLPAGWIASDGIELTCKPGYTLALIVGIKMWCFSPAAPTDPAQGHSPYINDAPVGYGPNPYVKADHNFYYEEYYPDTTLKSGKSLNFILYQSAMRPCKTRLKDYQVGFKCLNGVISTYNKSDYDADICK